MKNQKTISMPKSVKVMLALTPIESLPGLKAVFIDSIVNVTKAPQAARKSEDKRGAAGTE